MSILKQHPDDQIAWCYRHVEKNLGVLGVGKRKLAASRAKGLLRSNGINPFGFAMGPTVSIPQGSGAASHVCRRLFTRAEERHHVFFDNRDTLMGEAIGSCVVYDMQASEIDALMSAVRADMNQYLAAIAAG